MSNSNSFDLTVIGSGPGGYVAAIRAAQLGMKVAIVERENLGGICLNWGCIPTKALLKSAEVLESIRKAHQFGIKTSPVGVDFPAMIKRSRQIADRLSKGVGFLMKKNEIQIFEGTGQLLKNNNVAVLDSDGNESVNVHSAKILLATGARPLVIPGLEPDGKKLITYREAMTLREPPKSMIIIGAGAIGIEFAYFYNVIGTQVTLLEMMPQILPLEDAEVVETVYKSLKKSGIEIRVGTCVNSVDKTGAGVSVQGTTPGGDKSWAGESCLVAVGLQANSDGIGLDDVGIVIDRGYVKVDERYRTSVADIWAIGDLIGAPMLAHAASHEGLTAVEDMVGLPTHRIDPLYVPSCTYCSPQIASVGLTEAEARKRGLEVKIGRFPFVASSKAVAVGERDGLVKLIFDNDGDKLLGAHIVGSGATEMIAELGLAQLHPEPFKALTSMIHAHPTLSEAVVEAALDATGKAIHL